MAEVQRRELAEGDLSLGRVLDRRVEDLPARHVDVPVVDGAAAARQRKRQVGALADDADLARGVEPSGDRAHPPRLGIPVEQHGAEDEVLVLGERHPRLLRRGVRRVLADHPRHLHPHLPPAERLHPLLEEAAALVGEVGAVADVLGRRDRDERVALLPRAQEKRRRVREQLERRLARERTAERCPRRGGGSGRRRAARSAPAPPRRAGARAASRAGTPASRAARRPNGRTRSRA